MRLLRADPLISKLAYTEMPTSVKDGIVFAKDEKAKITLQFIYIPLGWLLLGIACLVVGSFAGVKKAIEESEGKEGG